MTLQIDQRLQNRYRIRDRLGQGGMGTVYLAEDLNLPGRTVAIKENADTAPVTQQQFQREAVILSSLNHPNLPRVTDHFIEPSGRQYLVMDYVQGEDLRELLQQQGALPEPVVLAWVHQVMDALEYMHSWIDPETRRPNPVIHRDIKPGNIKRAPDGRVVLVDFGLAKYEELTVTIMGARAVTPGYSPLEQYTGGTSIRSDIYALGATLYALLTGQRPPEAPTIANGTTLPAPRRLNPKITRATEKVILQAMQIQAAERYATVREMRIALFGKRGTNRIQEEQRATLRRLGQSLSEKALTPAATRRQAGLWLSLASVAVLLVTGISLTIMAPAVVDNLLYFGGFAPPPTAEERTTLTPAPATTTAVTVAQVVTMTATMTATIISTATLAPTSSPTATQTDTPPPTTPAAEMQSPTSDPTLAVQATLQAVQEMISAAVNATLAALPMVEPTTAPTARPTETLPPEPTPTPTTPTPMPTPMPTPTPQPVLPTNTPAPQPTFTATTTNTATALPTATVTRTPLPTVTTTTQPTATATPSALPTATASPTVTATASPTVTPTTTPSPTPSPTPTLNQTVIADATRHAALVTMVAGKRATLTAVALTPTATRVLPTPTPTITATATATPSATPTSTFTPAPSPTATVVLAPTVNMTLVAEQTAAAYATLEQAVVATLTARAPTATATKASIPTLAPTATPIPPTATVKATSTAAPTSTVAPTPTTAPTTAPTLPPTSTPAPTNTRPPTVQPTATPALPVGGSVTLAEPLDSVLKGRRTFRWSTTVSLQENQYFELVFWPAGQEPMSSSFGPVGSIKETSIVVDLDKTADTLSHLLQPGRDYEWGVLLVELNPYRRLQYLGGGHRFRFERSSGSSSSGGGGSAPATATPRGD